MLEVGRQPATDHSVKNYTMNNGVTKETRDKYTYHHTPLGFGMADLPAFRTCLPIHERLVLRITRHSDGYCVLVVFLRIGDTHVSVHLFKEGSAITLGMFQLTNNDEIFVVDAYSTCMVSFMNTSWPLFTSLTGPCCVWYSIDTFHFNGPSDETSFPLIETLRYSPDAVIDMPLAGECKTVVATVDNKESFAIKAQGVGDNVVSWYLHMAGKLIHCATSNMAGGSAQLSLFWYNGALFAQTPFKRICIAPVNMAYTGRVDLFAD